MGVTNYFLTRIILQALYHFIRSVSLWIRGFWQPRCCEGCVGRVERCGSGAQFIQDLSVSSRRCLVDFHIIFGILGICNVFFFLIRCSKIGQKAWIWMCRGIGFGCSCIAHQYVYMYLYSYITMICKLLGTAWCLIRFATLTNSRYYLKERIILEWASRVLENSPIVLLFFLQYVACLL